MKAHGAVLGGPGDWEVVELDVLDPGPGEVLVEMAYAGLCHSDEHLRHSNPGGRYPIVGGHEGSAVVQAVGAGVTGVAPGDHVVTSFLPACGHCRFCASGRSNLCDKGATIALGKLPSGTYPFRLDGEPLGGFCMVGEFAESVGATHTVAGADEAAGLARSLSRGTGADVVVVTVGKMSAEVMAGAMACLGKGGTLVLTALADRPGDGDVTLGGQLATVF